MDTRLTDEELAFRDEVRTFLAEAWDDELKAKIADHTSMKEGMIEWHHRLNARGWMAPNWPVEYGGTGWSVTQTFIWNSERARLCRRWFQPSTKQK